MVKVIFYKTVSSGQVIAATVTYDGEKYTCEGNENLLKNLLPPESDGSEVILAAMEGAPARYDGGYLRAEYVDSAKGGDGSGHYGHPGLPGVWGGSAPSGGSSGPDRRAPGPDRPPSNEGRFIESASKGHVEHYENYGGGINDADRVTYEDDGDGIWKELEGDWHDGHAEVLVYELDQALGLNIVPPTVYSELEGVEGTSQFFLEGALSGREVDDPMDTGWVLGGKHPDSERLLLLDHLIGNKDRHEGNWMVDDDDKLWAVDNGLCHWGSQLTPLGDKWKTGAFLSDVDRHAGEYTFSPNMMSRIQKFVGKTPKRPGLEYRAFVLSFSPRVRKNRMEQIDSVWLTMVELVGDEGTVLL